MTMITYNRIRKQEQLTLDKITTKRLRPEIDDKPEKFSDGSGKFYRGVKHSPFSYQIRCLKTNGKSTKRLCLTTESGIIGSMPAAPNISCSIRSTTIIEVPSRKFLHEK